MFPRGIITSISTVIFFMDWWLLWLLFTQSRIFVWLVKSIHNPRDIWCADYRLPVCKRRTIYSTWDLTFVHQFPWNMKVAFGCSRSVIHCQGKHFVCQYVVLFCAKNKLWNAMHIFLISLVQSNLWLILTTCVQTKCPWNKPTGAWSRAIAHLTPPHAPTL